MRAPLFALLAVAACGGGGPSEPIDASGTIDSDLLPPPDAAVPPDAFGDHGTTTFTATKHGNPLWETAGWQAYTAIDNLTPVEAVFSQHTYHSSVNAFGPGPAHQPPYDTEVADAVDTLGYPHGDHFHYSEWVYPQGILFNAVIVPSEGAPTGQTADFADGPIIPDANQLIVDGDMYLGNTNVDPEFDSTYPRLSTIDAANTHDGWSHMTLSFGEDTSYIAGTPGDYRMHVHIYESATPGNGWDIDIPFTVDP